ncbi:phytochrome-like protein cph2 [bacterium BMS3Abin02]|nr:phytochrome-like protein cph2 [bacterium BMS3Abin02]GBE21474.1 phytochrome-like protein cph2 [bacterium BMS3Bbin01]
MARLTLPTVVVVDAGLSGAQELVGKLRSSLETRLEVIAASGFGSVDGIGKMVLSGASAFIVKGKPSDLVAGVRSVSVGSGLLSAEASAPVLREVRKLYERERTRNERLEKAVHRLQTLSVTDPLTGLKNHGFFFDRLGEELERARRYERPLAVIIADIDDFKAINDMYGHAVGDRVLRSLGEAFRGRLREVDIACRIGGEEFGFALPETDETGAVQVAERLLVSVEHLDLPEAGFVTLSIGISVFPTHADNQEELVESADMALYQAKHEGKNCVRVAGRSLLTTEVTRTRPVMAPVVDALIGVLRLRSPSLFDRSTKVAEVVTSISGELGLSVARTGRARVAAMLHDIGMVGVPDSILLKPGPLEPSEWEVVRRHPHSSIELIAGSVHPEVIQAVLTHHERMDGSGYPNGVSGASIPLLGRVLHTADAFVAMISTRPQKAAMTSQEAIATMHSLAGTDFDSDAVDALERAFVRSDFAPLRLVVG